MKMKPGEEFCGGWQIEDIYEVMRVEKIPPDYDPSGNVFNPTEEQKAKAEDFIHKHSKHFNNRITELGWEVWEDLYLGYEQELKKEQEERDDVGSRDESEGVG